MGGPGTAVPGMGQARRARKKLGYEQDSSEQKQTEKQKHHTAHPGLAPHRFVEQMLYFIYHIKYKMFS